MAKVDLSQFSSLHYSPEAPIDNDVGVDPNYGKASLPMVIGSQAASAAIPTAAAVGGGALGSNIGGVIGGLLAAPLGPEAIPIGATAGEFLGGLGGGIEASTAAGYAQSKALQDFAPQVARELAQQRADHPILSTLAQAIPQAAAFKITNPLNLFKSAEGLSPDAAQALRATKAGILMNAGVGAGMAAIPQLASGQPVDLLDVAKQAAMGSIFGENRDWAHGVVEPLVPGAVSRKLAAMKAMGAGVPPAPLQGVDANGNPYVSPTADTGVSSAPAPGTPPLVPEALNPIDQVTRNYLDQLGLLQPAAAQPGGPITDPSRLLASPAPLPPGTQGVMLGRGIEPPGNVPTHIPGITDLEGIQKDLPAGTPAGMLPPGVPGLTGLAPDAVGPQSAPPAQPDQTAQQPAAAGPQGTPPTQPDLFEPTPMQVLSKLRAAAGDEGQPATPDAYMLKLSKGISDAASAPGQKSSNVEMFLDGELHSLMQQDAQLKAQAEAAGPDVSAGWKQRVAKITAAQKQVETNIRTLGAAQDILPDVHSIIAGRLQREVAPDVGNALASARARIAAGDTGGAQVGAAPDTSPEGTIEQMVARNAAQQASAIRATQAGATAFTDQVVSSADDAKLAAKRKQILQGVLNDPTTRDPVNRFRAALRSAGFQNLSMTDQEAALVGRFEQLRNMPNNPVSRDEAVQPGQQDLFTSDEAPRGPMPPGVPNSARPEGMVPEEPPPPDTSGPEPRQGKMFTREGKPTKVADVGATPVANLSREADQVLADVAPKEPTQERVRGKLKLKRTPTVGPETAEGLAAADGAAEPRSVADAANADAGAGAGRPDANGGAEDSGSAAAVEAPQVARPDPVKDTLRGVIKDLVARKAMDPDTGTYLNKQLDDPNGSVGLVQSSVAAAAKRLSADERLAAIKAAQERRVAKESEPRTALKKSSPQAAAETAQVAVDPEIEAYLKRVAPQDEATKAAAQAARKARRAGRSGDEMPYSFDSQDFSTDADTGDSLKARRAALRYGPESTFKPQDPYTLEALGHTPALGETHNKLLTTPDGQALLREMNAKADENEKYSDDERINSGKGERVSAKAFVKRLADIAPKELGTDRGALHSLLMKIHQHLDDKSQVMFTRSLHNSEGKPILGLYNPNDDTSHVVMSGDQPLHPGTLPTAIHELIHGITERYLSAHPNSDLSNEIQNLLEVARGRARRMYGADKVDAMLKSYREGKPYADTTGLKHQLYGLTNSHEYLAETFSNQNFRNFLEASEKHANPSTERFTETAKQSLRQRMTGVIQRWLRLGKSESQLLRHSMDMGMRVAEAQSGMDPVNWRSSQDAVHYSAPIAPPGTSPEEQPKEVFGGTPEGKMERLTDPKLMKASAVRVMTGIFGHLRSAGLKVMDQGWMSDKFGKYFTTKEGMNLFKILKDNSMLQNARRDDVMAGASDVLDDWVDLHNKDVGESDRVNNLLYEASVARRDARSADKKFQYLNDAYKSLSPSGQKVYDSVRDTLDNHYKLIGTTLERVVMQDDGLSEQDKREAVAEIRARFREVHGYFPLMRFGKYLAVGESQDYATAREQAEGLRGQIRDLPESQLMRKLQQTRAQMVDQIKQLKGEANQKARADLRAKIATLDTNLDQARGSEKLAGLRKQLTEANKTLRGLEHDHRTVEAYDSEYDMRQRVNELRQQGWNAHERLREDFESHLDGVSTTFMNTLNRRMDQMMEVNPDSAQGVQALKRMVNQLFLDSLPDASAAKRQMARKSTGGYSTDGQRTFATAVKRNAIYISHIEHGYISRGVLAQMGEMAKTQGLQAQEVYAQLRKHFNAIQEYTNTPIQSVLQKGMYAYYLGMSPSFTVTHLMQTPLVTAPMMTGRFGMGDVAAALSRAAQEVGSNYKATIPTDGAMTVGKTLAEKQLIKMMALHNTFSNTETDMFTHTSMPTSTLGRGGRTIMHLAALLPHHTERFNRLTTGLAAFRLAANDGKFADLAAKAGSKYHVTDADLQAFQQAHREIPGVKDIDAKQLAAMRYAEDITLNSHVDYTRENSPYYLQPNAKGVHLPKLMAQFQKYQFGMIKVLGQNFDEAFDKNLAPEDRSAARRVLAGILANHAVVTGLMGLPGYGLMTLAANIYHKFLGDQDDPFDAETSFRNKMADIFGVQGANVVDRGILYMPGISNVLPADITDRVGMGDLGNFFNTDRISGQINGDSTLAYWGSVLGGPTGAFAANIANAYELAHNGEYERSLELTLPKVFRDAAKASRFASAGVFTGSEMPVVAEPDLSAADIMMQALGFQPQKVTSAYAQRTAVNTAMQQLQDRRGVLTKEFVKAYMTGDTKALQKIRQSIDQYNNEQMHNGLVFQRLNYNSLFRAVQQRRLAKIFLQGGVSVAPKQAALREMFGHFADPGDQ